MSEPTLRRWPWVFPVVATLSLSGAVWLTLLNDTFGLFVVVAGMMVIGYGVVGAFLATRVPRNPIGWLMMTIAVSFGFVGVGDEYIVYTVTTNPGTLPFPSFAAWLNSFAFYGVLLPILVILLLFPDGRLMSPRWRIVLWGILASGAILIVAAMVAPGPIGETTIENPLGIPALDGVVGPVNAVGGAILLVSALASVIAVVLRYRRSPEAERGQIRPLAWVAAIGLTILLAGLALQSLPFVDNFVFTAFFAVVGIGLPLAIQNAVLRHRLYDLDVVIKKTVVFAIVVVLLVAVGGVVAVLVGFGLVPQLYDTPPLFLFFGLACGLLATPVYRLATRIADRVVYGGRASPSEVLGEFSERLSETYATDDVLPRMASILGEATRAKEVRVWLRVVNEYRATASWPSEVGDSPAVLASGDELPAFPGGGHRTEVRDRGELLGAITATFHANDPIDEGRERLIRDMAAQAGLVLAQRAPDREPARVSPTDGAARKTKAGGELERNIHDGAQQQLVALSVKTRLADSMIDRDAAKAHEMLAQIQTDTNDALETLRDLARGIYPPLLADKGLPTALEAQARKVTVPVTLDADGIGRYPADAEATVYFCVLEALQNVSKYADASTIDRAPAFDAAPH